MQKKESEDLKRRATKAYDKMQGNRVKVKSYKRKDGTIVKASVREYDPAENALRHINTGARIGMVTGATTGGTGGFLLAGPVGAAAGGLAGTSLGRGYGAQLGISAYNLRSKFNSMKPETRKKLKPLNKDLKMVELTISRNKNPNPRQLAARDSINDKRLRILDDFSSCFIGSIDFNRSYG